MTLPSEYASWKAKYLEAITKFEASPVGVRISKIHGNAVRTAWENMIRIVNVIAGKPEADDFAAEQKRHQEAEQNIIDRWRGKEHPLVQQHITFQKADTERLEKLNITKLYVETRPTRTIPGPAIR